MKPYGIKHVGPVCKYGCCWACTVPSGFNRKRGHGPANKKRVRRKAKIEIAAAVKTA